MTIHNSRACDAAVLIRNIVAEEGAQDLWAPKPEWNVVLGFHWTITAVPLTLTMSILPCAPTVS
jgi:hypothetical protein